MHWIDSDVDLPTLDRVELNQHAKQLGQMLFRYRPESGSGHTDTGQITLPGPLKWSVGLVIHTKKQVLTKFGNVNLFLPLVLRLRPPWPLLHARGREQNNRAGSGVNIMKDITGERGTVVDSWTARRLCAQCMIVVALCEID